MNNKKFTLWNRISALAVFLVSAVTYLLTIEPTASFWDCGEFIASSYKLEVGHPPGNPVFQLFAPFFFVRLSKIALRCKLGKNSLCLLLHILLLHEGRLSRWFSSPPVRRGSPEASSRYPAAGSC